MRDLLSKEDRRQKTEDTIQETVSPLRIIITALCLFLILYILLKLFVIDIMIVKGHSMEPTFSPGELIFINKLAYGLLIPFQNKYITYWAYPKRDDIILLKEPGEGKLAVKRCIAVAGDPVLFTGEHLLIAHTRIPYDPARHFSVPVLTGSVPTNAIFVMGDNPGQSVDSRHFGYIDHSAVYAKVIHMNKQDKNKKER